MTGTLDGKNKLESYFIEIQVFICYHNISLSYKTECGVQVYKTECQVYKISINKKGLQQSKLK